MHLDTEAIIVGGGQAALATAYYLRRHKIDFRILDNQPGPGGSWLHVWPTMTLFSTVEFSNLPGWPMPHHPGFPPASHVVDYLTRYEQRYDLPVIRPVQVTRVEHHPGPQAHFTVHTRSAPDNTADHAPRPLTARHVVAATGTWAAPFVPFIPGTFNGAQWHSAQYPGPAPFLEPAHSTPSASPADTVRRKVAVVGAANSGAQIAAELLLAGVDTTWFTRHAPRYLPDDVDGRVLFHRYRERALAIQRGLPDPGLGDERGDIIVLPHVKHARDAGLLTAADMFTHFDELNDQGFTDIIWCTGFRPAFGPIRHLLRQGSPAVPNLHLVGYGDIVGPGAATITGVGPYAKAAAQAIVDAHAD